MKNTPPKLETASGFAHHGACRAQHNACHLGVGGEVDGWVGPGLWVLSRKAFLMFLILSEREVSMYVNSNIWVHSPALLPTNCVTLGKLLDLSVPSSSYVSRS